MVLQLYGLASLLVFALAIVPFLRDPQNPKTDGRAWLFLAIAVLCSPITLPNMLWRWLLSRLPKRQLIHRMLSEQSFNRGHYL